MPGPIVIIGSINMDLVCRTRAMPKPGQTILGGEFRTISGGKGANQAVAAARLAARGTSVHIVGRVGNDEFGQRLLAGLRTNKVNTDHVAVTKDVASGIATILVDARGENAIVVAPGANGRVTARDVDAARPLIARAAVVVMQLEIPLATVRHVVRLCRNLGVPTILDPAPVPDDGLPRDLHQVDILTPNELEAAMLLKSRRSAKVIAEQLHRRGPRQVVLKLGAKGSLLFNDARVITAKPFKVKVVDTTAAGDAFTGAFAVAMAEGLAASEMLRFANAAGALCCTRLGAQPSLPTRRQVERLMRA